MLVQIISPNNKISNTIKQTDFRPIQADKSNYSSPTINYKNKQVGFGASIQYYAEKYLHSINFDSALKEELWDKEVTIGQAFFNIFNDKADIRISKMFNEIKSKISEMLKEIEHKEEQERNHRAYIQAQEREAEREIARIREQKEETAKEIKLNKINSKRKQLDLEDDKINLEEKGIVLEKELLQDQKFSIYSDSLNIKFINMAQNEKKIVGNAQSIFPNGIMLSGFDENSGAELASWVANKSGCKLKEVNFADLTQEKALATLINISENSLKSNQRTLIHIKNFDKYTTPIQENENIIGKLKAFLSSCAQKYKCTVITEVKNPKELAPEINADQRFKVRIDIDD